jgi:hypothetical protein
LQDSRVIEIGKIELQEAVVDQPEQDQQETALRDVRENRPLGVPLLQPATEREGNADAHDEDKEWEN